MDEHDQELYFDDPEPPHVHEPFEEHHGHHLHAMEPAVIGAATAARFIDAAALPLQKLMTYPELCDFRGALFAAICEPSHEAWCEAYMLPMHSSYFSSGPTNLWGLVTHFTSYSVMRHEVGTVWPEIPSGAQVAISLHSAFQSNMELLRPFEPAPWEPGEQTF